MHPLISIFPNSTFYKSELVDSQYVRQREDPAWMKSPAASLASLEWFAHHLALINVKGFDGEQVDKLKSMYNKLEEDCVMALLRGLMRSMKQQRQDGVKYDVYVQPSCGQRFSHL
jgi:superfamily I DNA and/or RNA helicase